MWYYLIYSCKSMWACRALCAPHSSLFSPHSTPNITFTARWRGRTAPLNEAAAAAAEREMSSISFSPHSVYLFTPRVKRALQSNLESFLCSLSDCLEQNAGEIWSQRDKKMVDWGVMGREQQSERVGEQKSQGVRGREWIRERLSWGAIQPAKTRIARPTFCWMMYCLRNTYNKQYYCYFKITLSHLIQW